MSLVSKLLLQISLMFVISAVAFGQNPKNEAKKLFDAGGIYLSKGQLEEAIKCYSESIKLDPSSHGGYDMRAYAFDRAGKPDQAIADRTIVLEFFLLEKPQKPFAISRILVNRGLSYIDLGKHTEARNDYTKAINFTPDDANPYSCRGLSYYSTNKFDEAISDFTKAIDLNGKTYKGITELYYRGKSYLALNKKDEGLADLAKAKLIDPKYFSDLELGESKQSASKNNTAAPKLEIINLDKGVKLEMVLVPAGKFKMGFTKKEFEDFKVAYLEEYKKKIKKELGKEEFIEINALMTLQGVGGKPHEVTLTKPFYMGKYEVTQEQWESLMGRNPSIRKGTKLPVTDVSWEDCQNFIKKLNKNTKGGYRLPTEAEWEYTCRAGTTTAYSFGRIITPEDANYWPARIGEPKVVGSYKPNAFGLHDMHGNVFEWCEDWYGDYSEEAETDPKGPATGEHRVIRGVPNISDAIVRSSNRNIRFPPNYRGSVGGFRLAKTIDSEDLLKPNVKKLLLEAEREVEAKTIEKESKAKTKAKEEEDKAKAKAKEEERKTKAKEAQKKAAIILHKEVEEKEDLGEGIKLDLVLIPASKFKMESFEVTIADPFYIGKYEVTQEQWESVMGNNPSEIKDGKYPVTDVSWEDCKEFIKKLNTKTKGGYRLPTEPEWEHACRAGTTTAYSFGNEITPKDANYRDSKIGRPVAVGCYSPNAFGLYDMHGNVWEWCEDWNGLLQNGEVTDLIGPLTGEHGVLRGGSFYFVESFARSSFRSGITPIYGYYAKGFRLAKTP